MVAFARSTAERNELVTANLGLAYAAAHRWIRARPSAAAALGEREDIEQIALTALTEAADRYDSTMASFSTYATICIRFVLSRAAINSGLIRIPAYIVGDTREEMIGRLACASLTGRDDDFDPAAPEAVECEPDERLPAVRAAMRRLTARQRFVLRRRAEGDRFSELAVVMRLCRERVRQLERDALAKLRSILGVEATGSIVRPDRQAATG